MPAARTADTKKDAAVKERKVKTPTGPTPWSNFLKEKLKPWKEEHPKKTQKEAMAAMSELWKEAPENPRRGQPVKERKPRVKKTAVDTSSSNPPSSDD